MKSKNNFILGGGLIILGLLGIAVCIPSSASSLISLVIPTPCISATSTIILDSYLVSPDDSAWLGTAGVANHYAWGQSFTTTSTTATIKLTSARFEMKKASPTGNLLAYAEIYSHSGTYGASSIPNILLATSNAFDVSTLTTSYPDNENAMALFTFSGANQISLTASTNYVLVVRYAGDTATSVACAWRDSVPTHSGNMAYKSVADNLWYSFATGDMIFYVYGEITTCN